MLTAPASKPSTLYLALVTATTIVPVWMGMMDTSITNVGFGIIAGALNVSVDEITGINTVYMLAMLVIMPLSGWLATNLGRKNAFLGALALFTLASIACAFCHSLAQLVVVRFFQGLGAGAMQTLSTAALIDAYPKELRARAFQIWGSGVMLGPLLGPLIGGWILANYPWQLAFLINVPLGLAALVGGVAVLPDQSERGARSPFDWTSLALMTGGLAAILYALQEGPHQDWFGSRAITGALLGGLALIALFVWLQLRAAVPLVHLRPLRVPSYSIGLVLALISGIGMTGTAFIVPLYFQNVLGFDAALAGLGMLPAALGTIAGIQLAGTAWAKQLPPAAPVIVALLVMAGGTLWIGLLGNAVGFDQIIVPRVLQGLGGGLFYVPLNVLLVRDIPPAEIDGATGLSGVCRQLGISAGYAGISAILAATQASAYSDYANHVRPGALTASLGLAPIRDWLIAHGHAAGDAAGYALPIFSQYVARNALTLAYTQTLYWLAVFFVLAVPGVALLWARAIPEGKPS